MFWIDELSSFIQLCHGATVWSNANSLYSTLSPFIFVCVECPAHQQCRIKVCAVYSEWVTLWHALHSWLTILRSRVYGIPASMGWLCVHDFCVPAFCLGWINVAAQSSFRSVASCLSHSRVQALQFTCCWSPHLICTDALELMQVILAEQAYCLRQQFILMFKMITGQRYSSRHNLTKIYKLKPM